MINLHVVPPDSDVGQQALRGFFTSILVVFHGRPVTVEEVAEMMRETQAPGLYPPTGVLLVALDDDVSPPALLGCGGLKLLDAGIGEVKHVHVVEAARGRGLGERLMAEIERRAREAGCVSLRLDTRANLYAARRLYTRLGFSEVPRFNENPFAECWYEKPLV